METLEDTYTWLFQTLKCPKIDIVRRKTLQLVLVSQMSGSKPG